MRYIPGFTHVRRGTAAYRGALRVRPNAVPAWICKCPADHLTAKKATECAAAEWDRRQQGAREVFTLLHCGVCEKWWQDNGLAQMRCPRCERPLERLRVAVVERLPS